MPDHIHLLVESPPKYSPAQIAQYFKGISSKQMREEFLEDIKPYIWKENTLWARGTMLQALPMESQLKFCKSIFITRGQIVRDPIEMEIRTIINQICFDCDSLSFFSDDLRR